MDDSVDVLEASRGLAMKDGSDWMGCVESQIQGADERTNTLDIGEMCVQSVRLRRAGGVPPLASIVPDPRSPVLHLDWTVGLLSAAFGGISSPTKHAFTRGAWIC